MSRSDWLSLPALPAGRSIPFTPAIAVPRLPSAGTAGVYTPLGQDVAREVHQFIAQGAGAAVQPSPQASWLAIQAARQAAQAEKDKAASPAKASSAAASKGGKAAAAAAGSKAVNPIPLKPEQQAFLDRIGPWAQSAAQRLGVSARTVMAHAALESGWGQRPVRDGQGNDSLNLFGIKALGGWKGAQVQALTTEFAQGVAVAQTEPFRQYADLDATFADYVELLAHSPRYQGALRTGDDVQAFASALSAGGYATDPDYAQKLVRISRQIPRR